MQVRETYNYEEILYDCYGTDDDVVAKFHRNESGNIDKCVMQNVAEFKESESFRMFELLEKGERVGYFGTEQQGTIKSLTGFFLKPKYRTTKMKDEFWRIVRDEMRSEFYTGIASRNVRAEKHLINQGARKIGIDNKISIFKLN